MAGSTTAAGTKIAVSSTLPATYDAAGYGALTPTVIKGVESIPAFGPTSGEIEFVPLDGPTETHKGPVNYGKLQIPMAIIDDDAGQIILRAAAAPGQNNNYTFLVTYPTGAKRYFTGRVFGFPEEPGSASSILKSNVMISINTAVVPVAASA